jgi:hypothetical protein
MKCAQALCICEKGPNIDMIIAKLSHIGVGSLVGSINVIGLESSKFYKPLKKIGMPNIYYFLLLLT